MHVHRLGRNHLETMFELPGELTNQLAIGSIQTRRTRCSADVKLPLAHLTRGRVRQEASPGSIHDRKPVRPCELVFVSVETDGVDIARETAPSWVQTAASADI